MNKKKVTCSALAAMMFAGTTGFSAFAAMPDATVLIKDKAYALDYAENTANRAAIIAQLGQLAEGEQAILKLNNKWLNNDKTAADATKIPAVTYIDADGKESKYDAKDGNAVNDADFSVLEISAVGANKVQVNFNNAVEDAAKLKFAVKRDGVTVAVAKSAVSDDKKTATLEMSAALRDAEYEVTVTYEEKEIGSAKAKLEAAKLAKIAFLGEKAVLAAPNDFTKAIIRVELQNQYGENWAKKATGLTVFASPSDSAGVSYDANKGTITVDYKNQFRMGDKISVNLYDTNSGVSANAMLPVATMANVDKLEIGEPHIADEKLKDSPITNTLLSKTDVYLPITVQDADGYVLTDDQLNNLLMASPIAEDDTAINALSIVGKDNKPTITTMDGKQYIKIAGLATGKTLYPGDYNLNVHATGGAVATKTIKVVAEDVIDSFNFSQPDATMYPTKTAKVPFSAVSKDGKELTKATELKIKSGQEGIYTDKIEFVESVANGMNATKIEVQGATIKASEDKDGNRTFTLKGGAQGYATITITTSTGKFQSTRVKIEKESESTNIKGIDADKIFTLMENGAATQELDSYVEVINQYGDVKDLTAGTSLRFKDQDGGAIQLVNETVTEDGKTRNYTAVKPLAKGSETVTIELIRDSKLVDSLDVKFEVLDAKDVDGYDVKFEDGNKIFTGKRNSSNHVIGKSENDMDTLEFEVIGLKNGKTVKIAEPTAQNGIAINNIDNGLDVTTSANKGTINAKEIETKGLDKTAKLTIKYKNGVESRTIVKDVIYSDATPKAESVKARTDIYDVNGVLTLKVGKTYDLVGSKDDINFLIKDQYGKKLSADYVDFDIENNAIGTISEDGKLTVKKADESGKITLMTNNGIVSEIKVLTVN